MAKRADGRGRPQKDQQAFFREARLRLAERDERLASDHRTVVERFLGDPPADRSALALTAPERKRNV